VRFALALLALAALLGAPAAGAHGDPVSDRLHVGDVYFPEGNVRGDLAQGLTGAVTTANAAGYELKVALVASPSDLGTVSSLFGKPEAFAEYIASDLSGLFRGVTLVVMPGAFGVSSGSGASVERERLALRGLTPGSDPGALSEAAIVATRRLAAGSDDGESSFLGDRVVLVGAALGALALLVGARLLAGRRRPGPSP